MTSTWARFRAKVAVRDGHDRWTGSHDARGTGMVRIDGTLRTVQRAAWEFAHGPVPPGARVRSCPVVRDCVRADHLSLRGGPVPARADGPPGRTRRYRSTRLALTRAAVDLFRERGFDASTADDIAAAAGCSRSTFFRHFPSKEDAVFGDAPYRLGVLQRLLETAGPAEHPVLVARWALREQFLQFGLLSDPDLEAECAALWFAEPALHRRYAEIVLQWEGAVAGYLGRCWDVDPAHDVRCQVAATALAGAVRAALVARSTGGDPAAVIDAGFRVLERGLLD